MCHGTIRLSIEQRAWSRRSTNLDRDVLITYAMEDFVDDAKGPDADVLDVLVSLHYEFPIEVVPKI